MLHHCCCIQEIDSKAKALIITDTVEYLHEYLNQPTVISEDIMTHAIHFLSEDLKDVPTSLCHYQLADIKSVCKIFANWIIVESYTTVPSTAVPNPPKPIVPFPKIFPIRYPAPTYKGDNGQDRLTTSKGALKQQTPVTPKGRKVKVNSKGYQEPISARTISRVAPPPSISPFEAQHQTLYSPVAVRTRSRTVSQNFTTLS